MFKLINRSSLVIAFLLLTSCVSIPVNHPHHVEFGVNNHAGYDPEVHYIKDMGANWIRVDFNWRDIEPKKDTWDFSIPDKIVSNAESFHLKIYVTLLRTPSWAKIQGDDDNGVPDYMEWLNFVRVISERYKNRIQVYSIWNEPNLGEFWAGDIDQYNVLLKFAALEIRKNDPKALIASSDLAWLYSARLGISNFIKNTKYYDIVAIHMYGDNDIEQKLYGFSFLGIKYKDGLIDILRDAGLSDKSIWITETGSNANEIGDQKQADYISHNLSLFESFPHIENIFIYDLTDDNTTTKEKWGLIDSLGNLKPSYICIKRHIGEMNEGR